MRASWKNPLSLMAVTTAAMLAQPATGAVFFAAHPDDVELMMSRNLLTDIRGGYPTVVVLLSAGDAGNGAQADRSTGLHQYNQYGAPYYRVRLNAHEAAIARWVNPAGAPAPLRTTEHFGAGAAAVEKVQIGHVTLYHLNLPDAQLADLFNGPASSLRDVEGGNLYTAASLRAALRQIISRNFRNTPTVVINFPEYDLNFFKPGYNDIQADGLRPTQRHSDHADHVATGKFVQAAVQEDPAYRCLYKSVFMGYGIASLPDAMTSFEKQLQQDAFYALHSVLAGQGNVTWDGTLSREQEGTDDAFHRAFFGKVLWRAHDEGGSSTCAF